MNYPADTIWIMGGDGAVPVDPTGKRLDYGEAEGDRLYPEIIEFNLDEYRRWHAKAYPNCAMDHNLDILDVGAVLRTAAGTLEYDPPVFDHRIDMSEDGHPVSNEDDPSHAEWAARYAGHDDNTRVDGV